jgi:hypothetical protein
MFDLGNDVLVGDSDADVAIERCLGSEEQAVWLFVSHGVASPNNCRSSHKGNGSANF